MLFSPKTEQDWKSFKNEIALQNILRSDSVCEIIETFEHSNRIWVIMERMEDRAMTAICEDTEGNVSVEFCKYTLY